MQRDDLKVIMIFLDGVGIGKKDGTINPFFSKKMKTLEQLLGGTLPSLKDSYRQTKTASLVPLNATLGVAGFPQSGTGQTTLLTGINASRTIGKHFGPYPYSSLKPIIEKKNIFRNLHEKGNTVFYANAFPQQYFDYIAVNKNRITATTLSWLLSGFVLNDSRSLVEGKSLSSDITNERWNKHGFAQVPILSPQEAGSRLVSFTATYDFVFFEYFYTDHVGHAQSLEQAHEVLTMLDNFLEGVVGSMNMNSTLLLLTSDHGNIEDLSTKSHTRNPVPLLAVGKHHQKITMQVTRLQQVTPAIVKLFQQS
jgi:2,3-bisphosphoglycerate-independent phosphoglycerate mutase